MKILTIILTNIVFCLMLAGCTTRKQVNTLGKIKWTSKNDKSIEKGTVGILIQLYDFKTKQPIAIADVKHVPATTKDSTLNTKLLIFKENLVPQIIEIAKPGKIRRLIVPKFKGKNLLIYKLYLVPDTYPIY